MIARANYSELLSQHSSAMKISRVICIFSMMYVHVHLFESHNYQETSYFRAVHAVLVELLGRSSVPLLSALSGFLMFGYFAKYPFFDAVRKRAVVLLIPLMVWNVLGLLLEFIRGKGFSVGVNDVLPLWEGGHYIQLNFLRDLFVVSAATPVLVWLLQRFQFYGLLAVIALAAAIDLHPLLLRDQILVYYTVGIFIAIYRLNIGIHLPTIKSCTFVAFSALLCLIATESLTGVPLYSVISADIFDNAIRRPIGAMAFWFFAGWICQRVLAARLLIRHVEPAIFLVFLSHYMLVPVFGSAYASVEALHSPITYVLMWISIPFMCLGVGVLLAKLALVMPRFAVVAIAGKG